jgi:hypothetical protein
MRRSSRSLVVFGLVCALVGATTLTAATQAASGLDVAVYFCATTDDDLAGGSEFIAGFTGDQLDCLESAPADGVGVTVYDAATDSAIATGATSAGNAQFVLDTTASLTFYVGEDFNGTRSATFTVDEQAGAIITIVLFVDADGELEIAAVDAGAGSRDPVAGVGFTVYQADCTTTVAGEVRTDERGLARVGDLLTGAYCVRETSVPDGFLPSDDPLQVAVVAGQTASLDVSIEREPPPASVAVAGTQDAGQVLVSAFACVGAESAVEIDVRGPAAPGKHGAPGAADDGACEPINGLGFRIVLFGDEDPAPLAAATEEHGTVLLDGIPPTNGGTGPHLFRTVVSGSTFAAEFDVDDGAITTITVVVVEPGEAPAATTAATSPATATAIGGVSTLPDTGTGGVSGAGNETAWPLVGILALIGLGCAGYDRRRAA